MDSILTRFTNRVVVLIKELTLMMARWLENKRSDLKWESAQRLAKLEQVELDQGIPGWELWQKSRDVFRPQFVQQQQLPPVSRVLSMAAVAPEVPMVRVASALPSEPVVSEQPSEPVVSELPSEPVVSELLTEPLVSKLVS